MRRSRSRYTRSSQQRSTHAAPFFIAQDLTRRYHHPRWRPRHVRAVLFSSSGFPPFFWPAVFAHAHARVLFLAGRFRARARTRASARTHAHERSTTNDATCGPPAWLTGTLQDGGTWSVRSPLRRAPLLATPIATPLQGGRPERPRPFCFLNYYQFGAVFLELAFLHRTNLFWRPFYQPPSKARPLGPAAHDAQNCQRKCRCPRHSP